MYMAKIGGVWDNNESWYERNKDSVLDLSKFTNHYSDLEANTLLLTESKIAGCAKVAYCSPRQILHTTDLGLQDNGYLLLMLFANNKGRVFATSADLKEIGEKLKSAEEHATKGTSDYNRIRYTIDYLRKKLKLKGNREEDPFITKKGFGVRCAIKIKI